MFNARRSVSKHLTMAVADLSDNENTADDAFSTPCRLWAEWDDGGWAVTEHSSVMPYPSRLGYFYTLCSSAKIL